MAKQKQLKPLIKDGKPVTIPFILGETKMDFLRRLVKKLAGDEAELPKIKGGEA